MSIARWLMKVLPSVVLSVVAGCGNSTQPAGMSPPPPPPAAQPPQARSYDYSHKVLATARERMGRKWMVAILRFGDTKEVENVPWGPASQPGQVEGGQVNVTVKVTGQENNVAAVPSQTPPQMNKRARDLLKHSLVESEAFTVIERERILEIVREVNFGKTPYADPGTSPAEGELLCVRYLIEGSLGPNEDRTLKDSIDSGQSYRDAAEVQPGLWENIFNRGKVNREKMQQAIRTASQERAKQQARAEFCIACYLSVYDVYTGEVVITVMGLGTNGLEAIDDAVDELVDELTRQQGDPCVVAVSGENVYLDIGDGGVKPGARFQVIHPGAPIRDRDGQTIGHEETEVGEIEVSEVRPAMSVAKVVGKAGGISRGDLARPAKH